MVAKFTNFPGVQVIISATKKGCDKSRPPSVASKFSMVTSKARKVARACVRRINQFSVIGADSIFGLSRSRFQSPTTVTACLSRNSPSRPNAAQVSTKTDFQGQMGGSPKASLTASGRENQPAGDTQNIMILHEKFCHHLNGSGYDVCGC